MGASLKLYGDIGEGSFDFFDMEERMSAKMVSDFLDDNKDAKKITVHINSRGGDVQEGWAIHDLLVNSGKEIKTIGEGRVYSIATIIFLAGSERLMMKNADGLIHNPYIPPYTLADKYESDDLVKIAEALQQEEEKILSFYVERTGTDKAKLADYMKEDTKLSAQDMVDLGFATKVMEPMKAYAYFKPKSEVKMDEKAFFEKLGTALDGAIAKIANFSRVNPDAGIVMADKEGVEIKFEKSEGEPAVGDKATPDGTFVMADGKTIIIAEGSVASIEPVVIANPLEDKVTALEAEIETLKAEKEAAVAAKLETEDIVAKATAREAEAVAIVDELKALKNSYKPAGRSRVGAVDKVGEIDLNRVREIRYQTSKTE